MAEEEDISVKSDVAMSTSDQPTADSEKIVPLSYVMSQHTENEGDDDSDIIESVDIAVNEGNNEQKEEPFELEPEFEPTELEKPIAPKEGETANVDDNASIHSDGQLTTDNEEDEMENFTQNQISNGQNFDNNGQNFNQPLNEYNGNLEYTIPQNLLKEGEGLEDRLHDIRRNMEHLFNQMNIFNERLMDVENFDIEEFATTFLELSSLITVLRDTSREFDELQEKISSVVLKCLDKYEENATVCGGHLLNAKINKARQIRGFISSWSRSSDQLVEDLNSDVPVFNDEIKSNPYYDNLHDYQILSQNITSEPTGYTYVADIPPPILPNTFFVAPTALPSFSHENVINLQNYNDETDNERTSELPTDLIPTHMAPPPISIAPERPLSHNSPTNYIPPMISLSSSSSFNTPPAMISSNILPPMNIPPPSMAIPPQNIRQPLNILPQSNISSSSSDPKIILPLFQNKQNMPPKTAPVLIPGLNIANTAPLFAQAPSLNLINNKLSEPSLIPTQLPTVTSANYGSDNYRKQNPQIAPIINMNISGMGSKSPAQNPIPQPSSSSHIPSLLSIEVPFPIEILKRNQNQAQQQRFNPRSRRSPVINSEPKESTPSKEKESHSVKSDEPMDATEQQSVTEETSDDPINDNPGS